jgi:predicted metal-binding protein
MAPKARVTLAPMASLDVTINAVECLSNCSYHMTMAMTAATLNKAK